MGSSAILIALIGVAVALACLFGGFVWGRNNIKWQVEDAVKKERTSVVAREFSLRQQLEEKMVEVATLTARIEDLSQSPPSRAQSRRPQTLDASDLLQRANQFQEEIPEAPEPVIESADVRIQNLLKSLQDKPRELQEEPVLATVPVEKLASIPAAKPPEPPRQTQPNRATEPIKAPPAARPVEPVRPSPTVKPAQPAKLAQSAQPPQPSRPAQPSRLYKPARTAEPVRAPESAKPVSTTSSRPAAQQDEWQEFAASLAALTRAQK
jgi:hypothetical protein